MADTMSRLFVTGASGFIGQALCRHLHDRGIDVTAAFRQPPAGAGTRPGFFTRRVVVETLGPDTPWRLFLSGVDTIIHLAARVHVMKDRAMDPLNEFRLVNTLGTEQLAREAVAAGVRRIVYVSTIKVNGESTRDLPFTEDDRARPMDPYAVSKYEAEQILRSISADTGLEVVIVRPPLVYGPGVKGNLQTLLGLIYRGFPLPVAACRNRRSFVGLSNFVDQLTLCATHASAAGETFLVSDGMDMSTPELIRQLAAALGRPARLLSLPASWLHLAARMTGKLPVYERLCGSLSVDSGKIRRQLGWTPVKTPDEELSDMAHWYREVIIQAEQSRIARGGTTR
jgi:nucleoside-diphosphate-sugar epimerase